MRPFPNCGEVWEINLDPTKGHEQAGKRPCLVISDDRLNYSRAELAIVLPITSHDKRIPWHVPLQPPEGGLDVASFIMCEMIRSVSRERFIGKLGRVSPKTLQAARNNVRVLVKL